MQRLLVEIKARCRDATIVRAYLQAQQAEYRGRDHQIDTYFMVPEGRLKLREGNIEKSLIFYRRPDQPGPKDSQVSLCRFAEVPDALSEVLTTALGTKVIVDKQRDIYFIGNVKFHIDEVKGLGSFMEIEAIGQPGVDQQADLLAQCEHYLRELNVAESDLVANSYADLLLEQDA
ncbi:MAG: class IV adenylate cyclase [Bacteroidota bacterium]